MFSTLLFWSLIRNSCYKINNSFHEKHNIHKTTKEKLYKNMIFCTRDSTLSASSISFFNSSHIFLAWSKSKTEDSVLDQRWRQNSLSFEGFKAEQDATIWNVGWGIEIRDERYSVWSMEFGISDIGLRILDNGFKGIGKSPNLSQIKGLPFDFCIVTSEKLNWG